jgi:hypothetical protein
MHSELHAEAHDTKPYGFIKHYRLLRSDQDPLGRRQGQYITLGNYSMEMTRISYLTSCFRAKIRKQFQLAMWTFA